MITKPYAQAFRALFSSFRHFSLFVLCLALSTNLHAKEQNIKEIDLQIDIPTGFAIAQNFSGFINPQTFTTIRYKETVIPFSEAKNTLLQSLENIEEQHPINVSGRPGLLVRYNDTIEDNQFELWTLLFGDKISTIAVTASYPKTTADKIASKMLDTLKTTRWLRLASEQIFTGLPFVVDQSEDLKITQRNINAIIMMDKTPYDPQKAFAPFIVLSVGSTDHALDAIATFSRQLLKAERLEDNIEILKQQAVSISGIQGFEITASATDKITGKPVKMLQTVIYQKHRYLLIQAIVESRQTERFWPQFKAVINSVKFK